MQSGRFARGRAIERVRAARSRQLMRKMLNRIIDA